MERDNIRILIVDDSAVMRAILTDKIAAAPGMSVVGVARDGREAVASMATLHPDVVTLDLQMPGMDGLETLDAMLDQEPVRVIMVSALHAQPGPPSRWRRWIAAPPTTWPSPSAGRARCRRSRGN